MDLSEFLAMIEKLRSLGCSDRLVRFTCGFIVILCDAAAEHGIEWVTPKIDSWGDSGACVEWVMNMKKLCFIFNEDEVSGITYLHYNNHIRFNARPYGVAYRAYRWLHRVNEVSPEWNDFG